MQVIRKQKHENNPLNKPPNIREKTGLAMINLSQTIFEQEIIFYHVTNRPEKMQYSLSPNDVLYS